MDTFQSLLFIRIRTKKKHVFYHLYFQNFIQLVYSHLRISNDYICTKEVHQIDSGNQHFSCLKVTVELSEMSLRFPGLVKFDAFGTVTATSDFKPWRHLNETKGRRSSRTSLCYHRLNMQFVKTPFYLYVEQH